MSRTGSVKMKPPARTRVLLWIGFICACTGCVISILALPGDMLPINQALVVLDCMLITTWLAAILTRDKAERR